LRIAPHGGVSITRSDLLRSAAIGGGAAMAAGAAGGWLAATALARASDEDLAWVRFAITAEYVSAEFYRQARRSGQFRPREGAALQRGTAAQLAHLRRFRATLIGAGLAPIEEADLEVVFPVGAFETRTGVISLGRRLGGLCLHAYLGAVATVEDEAVRRLCGQVAASEAEQLAFFTWLAGPTITDPFPSVHGLGTAAEELARYLP
jgi:hypothetical protein